MTHRRSTSIISAARFLALRMPPPVHPPLRYIPGTDPLDPVLYRYTAEQRADLIRRLQAMASPGMLASRRGTARYWQRYREAKSTTAEQKPIIPTTPTRVAARLVSLTGCSFAAAAWALTDVTRKQVSQDAVKKQWYRLYVGEAKPGGPRGKR